MKAESSGCDYAELLCLREVDSTVAQGPNSSE